MGLKYKKSIKYMSLLIAMLWYTFYLFLIIKIYEEKIHINRLINQNFVWDGINFIIKVRKKTRFETFEMVFKK